ncbi:MAG: MBL fold metallo-hydrolase [Candidatus Bathyarchaeota archaeon]|nr:MAG: MBL fold metallo-hydrolase [Candidatus Bathyarchaeota archaeon]
MDSKRLSIIALLLIAAAVSMFLPQLLDDNSDEGTSEGQSDEHLLNLEERSVRLTILYDNNPYDGRLETAWGFSCLVELGDETILFDTGSEGEILARNIETLGVDVGGIDCLVLSHDHRDHTGGMDAILEARGNITIYMLYSFPSIIKNSATSTGATVIEVRDATIIYEGVATTGALGTEIREQALIINTRNGLVILTGCSHPGVVEIVECAKEITGKEVYLVMGGYHLGSIGDTGLSRIVSGVMDLGVKRVAPTHCTGDAARSIFMEAYGENYLGVGVGFSIDF